MTGCDACGDPITEENGLDGEPLKAERGGEVFTFCRNCDGYKTLRVPTADWVRAQRQRNAEGRQWGDQIVRPEEDTEAGSTTGAGDVELDVDTDGIAREVADHLNDYEWHVDTEQVSREVARQFDYAELAARTADELEGRMR